MFLVHLFFFADVGKAFKSVQKRCCYVVLALEEGRRPGRSEGYASPGNTDRPPDKDVAPWDHRLGPKGQPVSMVHPESRLTENAKTRKTNDVLDEAGTPRGRENAKTQKCDITIPVMSMIGRPSVVPRQKYTKSI